MEVRARWIDRLSAGSLPLLARMGAVASLARLVSMAAVVWFVAEMGPAPFAAVSIYLAVAGLILVAACGRYDQAILFAADPDEARRLATLASGIAVLVVLAVAGVATALWCLGAELPGALGPAGAILVLPLSVAARVASRVAQCMTTRAGRLDALSRAGMVQAIVHGLLLVGLCRAGLAPEVAYAVSDAASFAAGAVACGPATRDWLRGTSRQGLSRLGQTARDWRQMPAWNMPMALLSVAALSTPQLVLPAVYDAGLAGRVLFAMRLFELPVQILTGAATPILQLRLAQATHKSQAIRDSILGLAIASAVVLMAGLIGAWLLDQISAVGSWQPVALHLPWIALYFGALLVSGPLIDLAPGVGGEPGMAIGHTVFLLACLAISAGAAAGLSLPLALMGLAAAMLLRTVLVAIVLTARARALDRSSAA